MGMRIFARLTEWHRDTAREESAKTRVQLTAIARVGPTFDARANWNRRY